MSDLGPTSGPPPPPDAQPRVLGIWDFDVRYLATLLLIALGVAVLLGGRTGRR